MPHVRMIRQAGGGASTRTSMHHDAALMHALMPHVRMRMRACRNAFVHPSLRACEEAISVMPDTPLVSLGWRAALHTGARSVAKRTGRRHYSDLYYYSGFACTCACTRACASLSAACMHAGLPAT